MGSFSGLNVGLSALYAQRRAIDIAGQNIANVNTDGYSRQRAGMVADSGPVVPAIFSRYEGTGQGVRSVDVIRMRDQFLETRAHQEHARSSYLNRVQSTMDRIELGFAEPSDTGLGAQMADFWAGWDDVGLNPADPAARSQLLERATTLATSFQQLDQSLADLGAASIEQLSATLSDVNAVAARIAELNGTIRSAGASGLSTNDLMDERDLLALKLAAQVGATVRPGYEGSLDVYVGAMALVRGTTTEALRAEALDSDPTKFQVVWADDGLTATVGGEAKGLLETNNVIVPDQRDALTAVAQALHDDVNDVHDDGFDQDGLAGVAFFQMGPSGIEVNPVVVADPRRIAAAGTQVLDGLGNPIPTVDGANARRMAAQTGPDSQYREMVVALGVATQTVHRNVDVQGAIVRQLDGAREAEAGVNIDEEMTNLIAFQHAYSAAARFVTTVDEMLDTLIRMV